MTVRGSDTTGRFTERHVSADGFKVRYLDGGVGPTVVMIHGGGGLDGELNDAHGLLADRYRVVALEMPGWGAEPNPRTQSLREMAATMAAAIEAAGIDHYRLIGTSLGAVVAAWIAAERPGAVSALVLEAPAVFRAGAPRPGEGGGPPDPAAFNYKPEKRWQRAPTPEQMELMRRLPTPGDTEVDLAARLPDLQVPTLIVFGRHDGLFSPARVAEHYRVLPPGHLTVFEEAAHDVKGDRPEAFAGVVDRFFRDGLGAVPEVIVPDDDPWRGERDAHR